MHIYQSSTMFQPVSVTNHTVYGFNFEQPIVGSGHQQGTLQDNVDWNFVPKSDLTR
jgi:hypothetical protein